MTNKTRMCSHPRGKSRGFPAQFIREKPVAEMSAGELAFIYKNDSITREEAARLKALLAERCAHEPSPDAPVRGEKAMRSDADSLFEDLDSGDTGGFLPIESVHEAISSSDSGSGPGSVSDPSSLYESAPREPRDTETTGFLASRVPRGALLVDHEVEDEEDIEAAEQAYAAFDKMPDYPPSPSEERNAKDSQVPSPRTDSFWYKFRRYARRFFKEPVVVVAVIGIVFLVFSHAFFIPSGSMRPTLVEGDRIFTIPLPFPSGSTYQRGDIACFTAPDGTVYVKRVIGVGGDHIQISGEKVYVNGEESPYQGTGGVMTSMDVQLADDEYWMMGDNRGNSEDSRFIGPVKADKMISKVIAVYLPLEHAKLL